MPVVLHHVLAERHRRQRGLRLALDEGQRAQQRQVVLVAGAVQPAHDPQRLAPVEAERTERIRLGELFQHGRRALRPQPQVAHRIIARATLCHEATHVGFRQSFHLAEAEPDRMVAENVAGAVGVAGVDGLGLLLPLALGPILLPLAGEGVAAKR